MDQNTKDKLVEKIMMHYEKNAETLCRKKIDALERFKERIEEFELKKLRTKIKDHYGKS